MAKVKNYARFYALLKQLSGSYNGIKEDLVHSHTSGRTSSLKEMTTIEYEAMCHSMQNSVQPSAEAQIATLKRYRSNVLHRLEQMGVDTSDWAAVDNYCLNPRIAGKLFRQLTIADLKALVPKLEAIMHKKPAKKPTLKPAKRAKIIWCITPPGGLPS